MRIDRLKAAATLLAGKAQPSRSETELWAALTGPLQLLQLIEQIECVSTLLGRGLPNPPPEWEQKNMSDELQQLQDHSIHVIVAERDSTPTQQQRFASPDTGPLVLETYTRHANHQDARNAIDRLGGQFGQTRIARLVFID